MDALYALGIWRVIMSKRVITAEVDQEWFDILSQITRHQDGFVWIKVKEKGEKESE